MKLLQLRYFYAACQYKNITEASRALYVSQPAITNAIRDLEKEFGVTLLQRLNRGFQLTEEGEYPDVKTYSYLVDAASMLMVTKPEQFEIVVTSNLFGDILTDMGAAIAGGMGLAAGANLNPERTYPSMFEPIHGSAPDIAGKQCADPLAAIWSASQMLDFFGYTEWAARLIEAIGALLIEKKSLTPDLGGSAATSETGDAVVDYLQKQYS